jgi:hypothetical protein
VGPYPGLYSGVKEGTAALPNKNKENMKMLDIEVDDLNYRAREIITEISKDGYSEESQLAIVCGALCIMLAEGADSMDDLHDTIKAFKKIIETGAKIHWFDMEGNNEAPRDGGAGPRRLS